MPRDAPRFDDKPLVREEGDVRSDDDDRVDILALEEEIFQADLHDREVDEAESPPERAARLCGAVQDGMIDAGFLEANEVAPAHTLERHVAKDDHYLLSRGRLPASTFTDLGTAERAIGETLRTRSHEIDRWLAGRPDLPQGFECDVGSPVGRVAERSGEIRPSSVVRAVLMPTPEGYRLKTAYVL